MNYNVHQRVCRSHVARMRNALSFSRSYAGVTLVNVAEGKEEEEEEEERKKGGFIIDVSLVLVLKIIFIVFSANMTL